MLAGKTIANLHQNLEEICSRLPERAEDIARHRQVPADVIKELKAAGLFRAMQPKKFGGLELEPQDFYDLQIKLASVCPSTGWVFGVLACHAWQLALFPLPAQEAVWGPDQDALISSSYSPVGKITPVEGGYKVSGRWRFSSGCDHCDWAFLGGLVHLEGAERPEYRTFMIHREFYEIKDDWFTSGLRGSGSKSIVVREAFCPEDHTHKAMDGFLGRNPGNDVHKSEIFRLPFGQVFIRSISSPAIGAAKGALKAFTEYNRERITSTSRKSAALDPAIQELAAEASSEIDAAVLKMHRNFNFMLGLLREKTELPMDQRFRFRHDSAEAVARCADIVYRLFSASGGMALYEGHPMNRYFQDIMAMRAHVSNNPTPLARNLGSLMMGERPFDMFV